jgi:hypothetical protein
MSSRLSTQPPIQWVPGALSLGVKRQGRETDHSPPTSAEIKKAWIYTATPPYAFMALCLINKHRENLPELDHAVHILTTYFSNVRFPEEFYLTGCNAM